VIYLSFIFLPKKVYFRANVCTNRNGKRLLNDIISSI
jgi:hypothetical protein